jgi:VWFA-related protein
VYDGDTFIDNLTIEDFEVYENGELQKVEAVYLIHKVNIRREETATPQEEKKQKYTPKTDRHFVLVFELQDWFPKVGESIDYFFHNVISPEESLVVITPANTYNLSARALKKMTQEQCAAQLKKILRKDIVTGGALYHSIVRSVTDILNERATYDGDMESKLQRIHTLYEEWRGLKYVEEANLLRFADYLKEINAQKHVFLFYQKEVLPQFNAKELHVQMRLNQDNPAIYGKLYDLFVFFNRDINLDERKIQEAFSDSSISIHFLYLTKTQFYGLEPTYRETFADRFSLEDKSSSIYSAFRKLADATGGISEASANANFLFKKAVDASENYYLLYYTPKDYKSDGRFRNIKVKVKGKKYRVLHRAGYLAD